MGERLVLNSDTELRENVIVYIKRCITLNIRPCFENYYIKYDDSNDILELLYIDNLICYELVVPNIFDRVGTDICSNTMNLKKIKFGDRLKVIGWGAFRYLTYLNTVDFSDCNNLVIGQEAFKGCYSLKHILYNKNSIKSIGVDAFHGCDIKWEGV